MSSVWCYFQCWIYIFFFFYWLYDVNVRELGFHCRDNNNGKVTVRVESVLSKNIYIYIYIL